MRLPGYLVAFLLTLLLASTTPVGTGAGVHQFDLLHPLFSHVHLINGRFVTHEELAREAAAVQPGAPGVAIGGSSAGAGSDDGIGVSPTLPMHTQPLLNPARVGWVMSDMAMPDGHDEAPPDPPPL